MTRLWMGLTLVIGLAACGGTPPFGGDATEPGGSTAAGAVFLTDESEDLTLNNVSYNAATDTLTLNNIPFDDPTMPMSASQRRRLPTVLMPTRVRLRRDRKSCSISRFSGVLTAAERRSRRQAPARILALVSAVQARSG